MNHIHWITCEEYREVTKPAIPPENFDLEDLLAKLHNQPSDVNEKHRGEQEAALLGLHFQNDGQPRASSYVGQVWLDHPNNIAAKVRPRQDVDQFRMVNKCLENPSSGKYLLKNGLYFFSEQPSLPVDKKDKSFPLFLLIARYLNELSSLCKRHIKRGFPRTEQNLTGRCKGSVRIKQNIIHNTAKGRMDRLYCHFQTHSVDNPANQILKAALEQSLRFLRRHSQATSWDCLWSWAGESSASLREVTLRRIHPSEFQQIHCKGLMKAYKQPLNLARIILRALGSDPNNPTDINAPIMLPPYAIDMNELFERYCEALLRPIYGNDLWAGYGFEDEKDFEIDNGKRIRPDFLLKHKACILDAKNKQHNKHFSREDIEQICLYSHHKGVRKELGLSYKQEPSSLVLMYPDFWGQEFSQEAIKRFWSNLKGDNFYKNKYFYNIYKILVPVPRVS